MSAFRQSISIRAECSLTPEAAVAGPSSRGIARYDGYRTDNAPCLSLYMSFPRIALSERPFNPCGKSARPTGQDIAVQYPFQTPVFPWTISCSPRCRAIISIGCFRICRPVALQQGARAVSKPATRSTRSTSRIMACCRCSPCCATARRSRPRPSAAKAWSARWPGSASTSRWFASWCRCRCPAARSPPPISGRSPPAAIPFAISASATTRCCCRRRG